MVDLPLSIYDLFILRNSNQRNKLIDDARNKEYAKMVLDRADPRKPFPEVDSTKISLIKKAYRESQIPIGFLETIRTEKILRNAIALGGFDPTELKPSLIEKHPFLRNEIDRNDLVPGQKSLPVLPKLTDYKTLFPIKFLGKGSYGAVFVVWIWGYGKAVLKIPTSRTLFWPFISESRKLKDVPCEHPNVLCARFAEDKYIIMDYYEGFVDLSLWRNCVSEKYYLKEPIVHGPEIVSIIATIFRQIAEGLRFLHSRGMVHRDIKSANILVKWDIPMIIDFGLVMTSKDRSASLAGSPSFLPSELWKMKLTRDLLRTKLTADEVYSAYFGADVYAIGVTLFQLIQNSSPFHLSGSDWTYVPKTVGDVENFLQRKFSIPIPKLRMPTFQEVCEGLLAPVEKRWSLDKTIEVLSEMEG